MGVNSLPKTVTRQRRDCDLNPGPSAPESSTLTTRLSSNPITDNKPRNFDENVAILANTICSRAEKHALCPSGQGRNTNIRRPTQLFWSLLILLFPLGLYVLSVPVCVVFYRFPLMQIYVVMMIMTAMIITTSRYSADSRRPHRCSPWRKRSNISTAGKVLACPSTTLKSVPSRM